MSVLQQLHAFDTARPSFPGEHWLALAAGIGLWMAMRDRRPGLARSAGLAASAALVARAASGRDGLRKLKGVLPGRGPQ